MRNVSGPVETSNDYMSQRQHPKSSLDPAMYNNGTKRKTSYNGNGRNNRRMNNNHHMSSEDEDTLNDISGDEV